jgi:hypothetical protein
MGCRPIAIVANIFILEIVIFATNDQEHKLNYKIHQPKRVDDLSRRRLVVDGYQNMELENWIY